MLDKYEDDIAGAILAIKKSKGLSVEFQPEDTLIANQVLLTILKSFVFQGNFDGAKLHVNKQNGTYSYIELPEVLEPLDDKQTIRDSERYNVLGFLYEYPESNFDFKEPWGKGGEEFNVSELARLKDEAKEVIEHLSSSSDVYAKILTSDSQEMIEVLSSLNEIELVRVENTDGFSIENKYCTMSSDHVSGQLTEIFGHRYINNREIRNYVVAKNWLGVVGLACLASSGKPDVDSTKNSRAWSLSFISVTPEYRQQGLSSRMMRECFNWAQEDEFYLMRTRPSDVGEKYTFDKYTQLAKKEYPLIPFVKRGYRGIASQLNKVASEKGLSYKTECKILQSVLSKAEELEKKHSDARTPYERVLFSGELHTFMDGLLDKYTSNKLEENTLTY